VNRSIQNMFQNFRLKRSTASLWSISAATRTVHNTNEKQNFIVSIVGINLCLAKNWNYKNHRLYWNLYLADFNDSQNFNRFWIWTLQ